MKTIEKKSEYLIQFEHDLIWWDISYKEIYNKENQIEASKAYEKIKAKLPGRNLRMIVTDTNTMILKEN